MSKKRTASKVDWRNAPDIKKRVIHLTNTLDLEWIKKTQIYCFRSYNSRSRAYARIWGLSRVWQKALNTNPSYIIEVLSEKFDRLEQSNQDEVLLHELAHIPKNFSGSLLPHIKRRGKRNFHDRVGQLISKYNNLKK